MSIRSWFLAVVLAGASMGAAHASIVLHRGQEGIVAHSNAEMLDSLGRVWTINAPEGQWVRAPDLDPPMPVEEILFWQPFQLVTVDGEFWWRGADTWINHGPWPGPAAVEESPRPPHSGVVVRPTPSAASVEIEFVLAGAGRVSVEIVDATGRRVRSLVQGFVPAGRFSLVWDGADDAGAQLASGVYFTRIQTDDGQEAGRVVLMR